MTLPTSGTISASTINLELGRASDAAFQLGGTAERGLAGISSGAIAFVNFHGRSPIIREPATGDYYEHQGTNWGTWGGGAYMNLVWFQNIIVYTPIPALPYYDKDGWRYFRGSFKRKHNEAVSFYGVYRIKL